MTLCYVPVLAESDLDTIVVIVGGILYGLYWLIRKIAESREAGVAPRRPRSREEGAEAEDVYQADEEEVQRFLRSLGLQPEEPPSRPPTPPPVAPPPRPEVVPVSAPPKAKTVRRTVADAPRPKPARPEPKPETEYVFGAGRVAAAEAPPDSRVASPGATYRRTAAHARQVGVRSTLRAADRLELSHLSPLQRAVVLSEILRRPGGPRRLRPR